VLNLTSLEPGKRLTRRDLYNRYHSLLEHVLSIAPTLTKSLQPILARKFPHKRLEKVHHVTYIRNILRLAQYCPGLSDHIHNSVIEKAIQIDVGTLLFLVSLVWSLMMS
jgi:RNA polymerase I-specific transcription initiation factor RRN3